ncbi:glycosyltransferase [Methyloceanibacter sp. wino2]|uniref:glycosyltransferase n=1 Tax=Methyloceanibacter sp. wino2 TaxID=2170729 RepID=UPI00131F3B7C|nr:glycosyltransferase [Methyloceanibacter sp. wino2]
MTKVSVILSSFNHGAYIRNSIESVLNQSFRDFELVIWDDASKDDSWDIICSYKDPRIQAFRNPETRRGIFGFNKTISEIAQGKYIAIHHSDDVWEHDKLEKQVSFLDTHEKIGAVFSNALAIDERGEPLSDGSHFYSNVFEQENRNRFEWLRAFYLTGNCLCHPSVLMRKTCYDDCGSYRYGLAQLCDFDMWVRVCLKYEIHVLPEQLVKFRVRDGLANASADREDTRIRSLFETYKILDNYRSIGDFDHFCIVFPNAAKYCTKDNFYADYALAMVCLEHDPTGTASIFALDILFDNIADPERADLLSKRFDFDYRNFVVLTGKHDVFSLEAARKRRQLGALLEERERAFGELEQTLEARDKLFVRLSRMHSEVLNSTSWRITLPLRYLASSLRSLCRRFAD